MNKDQIKGAAKASMGKLQRAAGKLVGSRKQQAKGIAKQIAGKVQQRLGDVEEALETRPRTKKTTITRTTITRTTPSRSSRSSRG